jgi:MbtH protein
MAGIDDPRTEFKVVLNGEEQYSIWPAERANPAGWRDEGRRGTRAECLAHIEEVWTDMRPRSVRERERAAGPRT